MPPAWLLLFVHYVGAGPWWEDGDANWQPTGMGDSWEEEWPSSSSSPSWSSSQPWAAGTGSSSSTPYPTGQHGDGGNWTPEQVQMHMALAWDENVSLALQAECLQEDWQGLDQVLAPIPEDLPLPFTNLGGATARPEGVTSNPGPAELTCSSSSTGTSSSLSSSSSWVSPGLPAGIMATGPSSSASCTAAGSSTWSSSTWS